MSPGGAIETIRRSAETGFVPRVKSRKRFSRAVERDEMIGVRESGERGEDGENDRDGRKATNVAAEPCRV